MSKDVQAYSAKGFFPAPTMKEDDYLRLMAAREMACRRFVSAGKESINTVLNRLELTEFTSNKYTVQIGTVPDSEVLGVWESPIPHIMVEYNQGTSEWASLSNPICDLRKKKREYAAPAYMKSIQFDGTEIPVIVTTRSEGVRIGHGDYVKRNFATPYSMHELIHACRLDLDSVGLGPLLVEVFSHQFLVEEQIAAIYEGLRSKGKQVVTYIPQFVPDNCGMIIKLLFPFEGITLEDCGAAPSPRIRNIIQKSVCKEHADYEKGLTTLEELKANGLGNLIERDGQVVIIAPQPAGLSRVLLALEANVALRTEESLTQIAETLRYTHTKFLRVVTRLGYKEVNAIRNRLVRGKGLEQAISEVVQLWRMPVFEEILRREDEVKLISKPGYLF